MKYYALTLCLLFTLTLSAFSPSPDLPGEMVELKVEGIYEYGSAFALVLEEKADPNATLVMIIGQCEATGIARSLSENSDFPRPLTYPLIGSILETSSLKAKHVIVTKLEDGTYFANIIIQDKKKELVIDSRPSDAINIALTMDLPIYADATFWEENKEVKTD